MAARTLPNRSGGRRAGHLGAWRPRAQPQEHQRRAATRQADRVHRPVGLGQVEPGLRHHLRRGSAALRRVAVVVRPPVPRADGQAGRRRHRGPLPGHLDRPEVGQPQPALDRRHDHRDLRLPAPAVRPRRHPALPRPRQPPRPPDPAADRRSRPAAARGHPVPGPGTRRARSQGRVRDAARGSLRTGLRHGRASTARSSTSTSSSSVRSDWPATSSTPSRSSSTASSCARASTADSPTRWRRPSSWPTVWPSWRSSAARVRNRATTTC